MSTLDDVDLELVRAAGDAAARSYSRYSRFEAGAAVLGGDGSTRVGVIVENVSLGLAMCAERGALFATVAAGDRPTRLALVAPDTAGGLTWPCGACLQVALELGGPELSVVVAPRRDDGSVDEAATVRARLGELLPRGPRVP